MDGWCVWLGGGLMGGLYGRERGKEGGEWRSLGECAIKLWLNDSEECQKQEKPESDVYQICRRVSYGNRALGVERGGGFGV